MKRTLLALPALFVVALFAKEAEATKPTVAVLDLQFADAALVIRKQAVERLRSSLVAAGYRVLDPATVKKRLKEGNVAPGCSVGPCLRRVGRVLGADHILVGGVAAHGSSYDVVLTLLEVEGGSTLGQVSGRCDVCTFADVASLVARATTKLCRQSRDKEDRQGRLVVKGDPRGAEVWLDGVPIGRAPLSTLMAPGVHRLVVRKAGRVVHHQRVKARARGLVVVSPTAAHLHHRINSPPGAQLARVRWPAWLALGVSGSLLVAGTVALALDEDCPAGSCGSRRSTHGVGLGLLGGSLAAAIGTGVLFWHYQRPEHHNLAFGVFPGGAQLSYSQRF